MTQFPKDPDAVLPYQWDWSGWLDEDTISAHEIMADGVGVDSSSHTDTAVTAVLSGGEDGTNASVTCRVTTAEGYVDDRTLTLRIRER